MATTLWLCLPDELEAMDLGRSHAPWQPTVEERAEFAAALAEHHAESDGPRILRVSEGVATIAIKGVLTETPDCFALMFGGGNTTYRDIRHALATAENDPRVDRVELEVASPGGTVEGLFETFAAMDRVTKPMRVRATRAASAAYGLASYAGPIEALTPVSSFGSIGVAVSARIPRDMTIVDITSTDAPKKRPDVRTDEGRAMVREELDAIHEQFVRSIASGRSRASGKDITSATVNKEFGRGGMLLAATARSRGMIDSIAPQPRRAHPPALIGASAFVALAGNDNFHLETPMSTPQKPKKDYARMTSLERHELAQRDPAAFARARAEWEARGCPSPEQASAEPAPGVPYERWSNAERHYMAINRPERFSAARADWQSRGEPSGPEAA